ncbi:alcohol oxidase [Dentipellis sp. KUC8613]|nr:alcohol oxidase [Dentipellis sp. KUC8613]
MPIVSAEDFAGRAFDYVVAGGGIAGLVVAARLSEDPNVVVGVIEAGKYVHDMPEINIPGRAGSLMVHEELDWNYSTTPQEGAKGRSVPQPRGKVLGGSSATNILVMGRAPKAEYDAIEKLGNPGWNWSEFLKYLKKSETFTPMAPDLAAKFDIAYDPANHGTDGPLQHSYPPFVGEMHGLFEETLKRLGVPHNPDPNGGNNVGSTLATSCVDPKNAVRSYATSAYYEPNANRPNLLVVTHSVAGQIVFAPTAEGSNDELQATGLEFIHDGKTFTAKASKEVILAAGALKSPQILELSGIGVKDVLAQHGIECRVDLPVGENLQDHAAVITLFEVAEPTFVGNLLGRPEFHRQHTELYLIHCSKEKKGFYTSSQTSFAYLPLRAFVSPEEIARMKEELLNDPIIKQQAAQWPGVQKQVELLQQWFDDPNIAQLELLEVPHSFGFATPGERHYGLSAALLHPLSRGRAHLVSPSPLAQPALDPAYLARRLDAVLLTRGLQFVLRMLREEPLAARVVKRVAPEPKLEEAEGWEEEYCRGGVLPVFHPVGTAGMMPREDGGVVDPQLRVYGTRNVRVVDASVLPFQLSCHSQATVYAIAEKAADLIKEAQKPEPGP